MWSIQRWAGTCNFFLSPQSQFRNLKEALPQPQFRNFLRNIALQLRNSATTIFSEVRNLRASLLQFSAYFWPWSSLKLDFFLPPGIFLLLRGFYRDSSLRFSASVFFSCINPIWTPESYSKRFLNLVSKLQYPKFRVWIRNLYGVDSWKKKSEAKNLMLLSL